MTVFIRLIIVFVLNLFCFQFVWAEEKIPDALKGNSLSKIVTLSGNIAAHPLGEEVDIVVPSSLIADKPEVILKAHIRWQSKPEAEWTEDLPLRIIDTKKIDSDKYGKAITTVSIRLPEHIKPLQGEDEPTRFWNRPIAEIQFIVTDKSLTNIVDTIIPIHIVSSGFAFFIAISSALIFWLTCFFIADSRKIPGDGFKGFILKVIVNKYGYASLSQFQIMLWTFVVGGSAVYVMILTGTLIDIEETMLILLGGAGVVSTLTAFKPTTGTNQNPAQTQQVTQTIIQPGVVVDLQVCGKPGDTQVVLVWKPPVTGGMPDFYEIQYRISGTVPPTAWTIIINSATESPVTVAGLTANTIYDFQVCAVNTAGSSSKIIERVETVSASIAIPAQVQGVSTITEQNSITVSWSTPTAPDGYVVRYRETGTGLWVIGGIVGGSATSFKIQRLWFDTDYEFEVFAVTAGKKSEASIITSRKTAWRQPEFADLLMAQDSKEIDVSRIQMLFFTVITAFFVVLKVLSSHEIPEIPAGILLLMGISNGVYLTAKYIPQKG